MDETIRRGLPGEGEVLRLFTETCFLGKPDGSFLKLLPKLYEAKDGGVSELLVCERGGTCAGLLADPVSELETPYSGDLRVGFIGCVCTDPAQRGSGVMKSLLEEALRGQREKGCVLTVLSGARSRYGHYGFEPGGVRYDLTFEKVTLSHFSTESTSLCPAVPGDEDFLRALWEMSPCRFSRTAPMDRYLRSWGNQAFLFCADSVPAGYASVHTLGDSLWISEFRLKDPARLPALLGLLGKQFGSEINLTLRPWETAELALALPLCDRYQTGMDHLLRVHSWNAVLDALLPLQERCRRPADGELTFSIDGSETCRLTALDGKFVRSTEEEKPMLRLTEAEASEVLLAPCSPKRDSLNAKYPMLSSWFPLPFSVPENDAW